MEGIVDKLWGIGLLGIGLALVASLSGCARTAVVPVSTTVEVPNPAALGAKEAPAKRICIVENPRVAQKEFLEAYRAALETKGFVTTIVQKNPLASVCPLTTRYVAYWNWDLIYYLSFAQLDVY